MNTKKFLAALATTAALVAPVAFADPRDDRDHDRDHRPEQHESMKGPAMHGPEMKGPEMKGPQMRGPAMHGPEVKRDRYWKPEYRGFVARDRVFGELRRHHYTRFAGDPYWFNGRYVVKTYDDRGRLVFVELNPYTGAFIGVVRF